MPEWFEVSSRGGVTTVTVPVVLAIITVVLLVVLLLILWSVKRRRQPNFVFAGEPSEHRFRSLVGLTHSTVLGGNKIEILQNGKEFFPALLKELRGAKQSIHLETFLWEPGEVADQVIEAMVGRAREGVHVRLLVDGGGGRKLEKRHQESLENAGGRVLKFHPYRLSNIGIINNRDHRKLALIDGHIGFVGGHCMTDHWLGDAQDREHFRDISVRVEGPVVHQLQSCFAENWIEESGDVMAGEEFFPAIEAVGDCDAHLVYVTTSGAPSSVKMLYHGAIELAQKQILIQNPYFLPDPQAIDAMAKACDRGVEVKIMVPSAKSTDSPVVQHASHHKYGALLKAGVRIFEYEVTLLHQKVITVDHVWSAIGSTNFDDRSLEINDEVSLGVFDEGFARKLEAIFEADLEHCDEMHLEEWKRRGVMHKLTDFFTFILNEQL